ncbi:MULTISPECIES: hypothetical protein [unclassified Mycobacterium]|uniref:hypothetical protein n=1 Tax=unclassified Mycobacterium TaxID=2642494 RepID=UPI00074008E0|nr:MULTISPECIES: hypothetical protein [unclassified Mycobacterium]KUH82288.1 hypothetical protein AU185_21650 [Mycobacterium sp. GA-0227b]KUH90147.1 hypothetical protein AU186_10790 [Mycobacterium sp. GA-1999]KUH95026.1 hypothetical protein AU187_15605 [Mycobacterium sp. IS-1556]
METLTRARHAQKRIFRAQRRLWLLQAALWPTVALAGIGAVAALVMRYRGRADGPASAVPSPTDGLPHL